MHAQTGGSDPGNVLPHRQWETNVRRHVSNVTTYLSKSRRETKKASVISPVSTMPACLADKSRVWVNKTSPPLPAAVVGRGTARVLRRARRGRAAACLRQLQEEPGRRSAAKLL